MTRPNDPWDIDSLDLDGYLGRLGVAARQPGREALDELHEAHVRTFTFDNIDVLLGDHPGVGLDGGPGQVRRPGPGRLLLRAQHAVRRGRRAARLRRRSAGSGGWATPARRRGPTSWSRSASTAERLLADPGFGMSVLHPILLEDGHEEDQGGWRLPRAAGRRRRGRLGDAPAPRRRVGADAHLRRAPGPAGRRGDGPPLHEHLPDLALPQHADGHPAPRRPAPDRHRRGA